MPQYRINFRLGWPLEHLWGRLLLGLALSLLLGLSPVGLLAQAQLPNLWGPSGSSSTPPIGVQRIGLLEAAPVALDGIDLFQIASPAVFNRNEPGGQVPVEVRARQIESNLNQVISQSLQVADDDSDGALPSSAPIEVIIEQINGQPVLFATSNNLVEPKVLLTITDTDAQFQAISQTILAERWQEILQIALRRAIDARQPDALRRQIRKVVWIVLATVLATLVLTGIWQVLGWRKHTLEERRTVQGSQWEPPLDGDDAIYPHHQLKQLLRYQISVDQRLQLVAFLRWLMFWSIAFVWIAGTAGVLYLFPQTRRYAFGLFSTPVLLLLAWFITGLLNRLANIGIERTAQAWGKNELGSLEDLQRKSMRVSTITGALKGLKTAVIYALALLLVLQILKIGPASLLAFGAVAALALSFGAQSLVRDLVNGFLILLEDQYAIGDLVATGNTTGIVENLNLRVTKIRGEDGRLVTLPNSLIAQVDNLSRNWSRANLTVDVGYDTDVNYALYVMQDVAQAMAKDPAWQYAILDPVEMIGVDAMTHAGITIRLWIRTRPLKQFLVGREFRRRLRIAFGQVGIAIGVPQQALSGVREEVLEPDPSHGSTPLPSEDSHAQVNSVDPAATG